MSPHEPHKSIRTTGYCFALELQLDKTSSSQQQWQPLQTSQLATEYFTSGYRACLGPYTHLQSEPEVSGVCQTSSHCHSTSSLRLKLRWRFMHVPICRQCNKIQATFTATLYLKRKQMPQTTRNSTAKSNRTIVVALGTATLFTFVTRL